jgi:predicted nucleic acid-binding protein
MKSVCFLDTNVLIYAIAGKADDARKHAVAVELFRSAPFGLSAQVLAEFTSVVSRRFGDVISAIELDTWLDELSRFPLVPIDADIVRGGLFISRRYRINYFDAALVAAAERLGATILYTEDLKHEQLYGSVQVINPFLPT